jgi:hypothetical protein
MIPEDLSRSVAMHESKAVSGADAELQAFLKSSTFATFALTDKKESETSLMRKGTRKSLEKMDRIELDDLQGKKSSDVRAGLRAIKFPTIPEEDDAFLEWDDFVPEHALYAFSSSALHADAKLDKTEVIAEAADAVKGPFEKGAAIPLDEVVSKVAAKPPPLHLMQAHSGDAGAAAIAESLWVCVPQVVEWGGLPIDDMSDACFFLHLATGMYLCAGNDTHTDADKMVLRCSITLSSSLEEATLFKVKAEKHFGSCDAMHLTLAS